jgi:hypothetical protein
MKKLFILITAALLLTVIIQPVQAQVIDYSTQQVIFNDTVGNYSSTHTNAFTLDVDTYLDSVKISIWSKGEIDIDSLITKFIKNVSYVAKPGYAAQTIADTSASSGVYGVTLTINLDSAATQYDSAVVTIPNTAFNTVDKILFIIEPATSGNDKADTGQRLVVIANKFYKYKVGSLLPDFMRSEQYSLNELYPKYSPRQE